jgi:L-threonylcarbamoyladenylate synthase
MSSSRTRVLAVNPDRPDPDVIRDAARVIRSGGLVAFPTETVYGLGANALDAAAVNRIYEAKQRPASDPIIAHIDRRDLLDRLAVKIPPSAYTLAEVFWPGPLTMILRRSPHVPANIAARTETIAVRMPRHPVAAALIAAAGVPIAAPSANTFTRPSATSAAHVLEDLNGRIDLVLDGGATWIGLESTVIDLTVDPPVVLRPGGVLLGSLRAYLPGVTLAPRYLNTDTPSASPGQTLKHYAPRARMLLFDGPHDTVIARMQAEAQKLAAAGQRVGVLAPDEERAEFAAHAEVRTLGSRDDLDAISHSLFAAMRMLDGREVDVILVRGFGQDGLGAALWDRLLRAAQGEVIQVEA